jgi:hypothetical protein
MALLGFTIRSGLSSRVDVYRLNAGIGAQSRKTSLALLRTSRGAEQKDKRGCSGFTHEGQLNARRSG